MDVGFFYINMTQSNIWVSNYMNLKKTLFCIEMTGPIICTQHFIASNHIGNETDICKQERQVTSNPVKNVHYCNKVFIHSKCPLLWNIWSVQIFLTKGTKLHKMQFLIITTLTKSRGPQDFFCFCLFAFCQPQHCMSMQLFELLQIFYKYFLSTYKFKLKFIYQELGQKNKTSIQIINRFTITNKIIPGTMNETCSCSNKVNSGWVSVLPSDGNKISWTIVTC